ASVRASEMTVERLSRLFRIIVYGALGNTEEKRAVGSINIGNVLTRILTRIALNVMRIRSALKDSPELRATTERRAHMKIVVSGGTGLIGSKTVPILRQRGHDAVAGSPNTGVNTITGEGVAEALAGAQVVVDLANAPSWEDKAVLEFFETSGRNLH